MAKKRQSLNLYSLLVLVRLPWHYPWLSFPIIALLLGWYTFEVLVARPAMAWMGLPQANQPQPAYWTHVLRNERFMVGYSEMRANPLWVIYHLTATTGESPHYQRPLRFETDWRSLARIGHDDYSRSGYTRGHLAPNHAIGALYGRTAQLETFLMTNISPQRAELNEQVWAHIEKWELDTFAHQYGSVWVITGPIFDNDIKRLSTSMQVEIPDAFYKILAVPAEANHGRPLLRAFIVPQNVKGSENMDKFSASVDEVESRSGFDFFSELPDELENRLESENVAGSANL